MIQYSNNVNASSELSIVSLKFRTRKHNGTLFHAKGTTQSSSFVTVQVVNDNLHVLYDLGEQGKVIIDQGLTDGAWLDVTFTAYPTYVLLQSGNHTVRANTTQSKLITDVVFGSDNVFVGGASSSYHDSNSEKFVHAEHFKGCLNEVRVGGLLLPVFDQSELLNNTSPEQFAIKSKTAIRIGCYGDPVCDSHGCKNGATCRDIWNAYECDCSLGFNGTFCGNNIDDCVSNNCQNGATCRDGIANYTCDCAAGYTDTL